MVIQVTAKQLQVEVLGYQKPQKLMIVFSNHKSIFKELNLTQKTSEGLCNSKGNSWEKL